MLLYARAVNQSRSHRLFVFKNHHRTRLPEPDSARRTGRRMPVLLLFCSFAPLLSRKNARVTRPTHWGPPDESLSRIETLDDHADGDLPRSASFSGDCARQAQSCTNIHDICDIRPCVVLLCLQFLSWFFNGGKILRER
jgi:hypothetical protein